MIPVIPVARHSCEELPRNPPLRLHFRGGALLLLLRPQESGSWQSKARWPDAAAAVVST